ncbi:bifunctional 3-phenylpropionate/cinnamic acid dioxygenase ferredoxin subunit [Streptomyces sp. NBC_01356]|uniref:bifunctional 3-phenylpropionate/cinnamic acid dioxygenase ferredoxin subunit n=1 Tax=Streptomyces sp. NBC_01356 TaxID=2903836 RepID=UPI002E309506|nr:bifunctional 3-phenylpropionate/cinnamic acid dioxygenase ferredoxin subunit [Streptomyces sp. NBC_01356]
MIEVCRLDELPPGEVAVVKTAHRRIAVFNADGELYAVDDRCTHQEAYLSDGWLEGCLVECPLHSASFDLRTGRPTGPPATGPVRVYAVEVRDGVVHVDTGTVSSGSDG